MGDAIRLGLALAKVLPGPADGEGDEALLRR